MISSEYVYLNDTAYLWNCHDAMISNWRPNKRNLRQVRWWELDYITTSFLLPCRYARPHSFKTVITSVCRLISIGTKRKENTDDECRLHCPKDRYLLVFHVHLTLVVVIFLNGKVLNEKNGEKKTREAISVKIENPTLTKKFTDASDSITVWQTKKKAVSFLNWRLLNRKANTELGIQPSRFA